MKIREFRIGNADPGVFDVRMPVGAKILHVYSRDSDFTDDTACVSALVPNASAVDDAPGIRTEIPPVMRRFQILKDGDDLPDTCTYLGTVHRRSVYGHLTFHLFELPHAE